MNLVKKIHFFLLKVEINCIIEATHLMLMLYLSYFSEAHPEGITISNYKKIRRLPTPKAHLRDLFKTLLLFTLAVLRRYFLSMQKPMFNPKKVNMERITAQITNVIETVSKLGIGLIALGIIAEIIFGQGAIFGASVVSNVSSIVGSIGGENGFVGLIALLLIVGLLRK